MAILLLFGPARQAAGSGRLELSGATVGEVVASACEMFGESFAEVVGGSAVWLNGEPSKSSEAVGPGDEVAVVPPVSGG